jgi:hypothetical protein
MLLTAALIGGSTALVAPAASAGPATAQCPSGGVKVAADASPAAVSVMDSTTAAPVSVVVTITGPTFEISAATDSATPPLDATWCVKSSTKTTEPSPGTGLTGHSASTNKKGAPQNIGYVVVYSVATFPVITNCYDSTSPYENGDLSLLFPLNTPWNGFVFSSLDGTCEGGIWQVLSIVTADDSATADAKCAAIADQIEEGATDTTVGRASSDPWYWLDAPADWWLCGRVYMH